MKCDTVSRICAVLDEINKPRVRDPLDRTEVKINVVVHVSDADWEDEMTAPEPDDPIAETCIEESPDGSTDQETGPE